MSQFTIQSFIAHLTQVAATALNQHVALDHCAQMVEDKAKSLIGDYQAGAGGVPGWADLADSTLIEKSRLGYSTPDPLLRDGTLRDSIKHVTAINEALVYSDDPVAVWQELGTSKIPPRSFLELAAVLEADKVELILGRAVLMSMIRTP